MLPAGGVDHQLGNGEGRDLVGALVQQPLVLRLDLVQAADAASRGSRRSGTGLPWRSRCRESRTASMPATMANCVKRSMRLTSLADM